MNSFSVDYRTMDGTAEKVLDYTEALGTLNFNANEMSKTIKIFTNPIPAANNGESDEYFFIELHNPSQDVIIEGSNPYPILITE